MARTKAEIVAWFNSKVGTTVVDKSNSRLNGQCVALEKNLLDFLGAPNPYAARGNAKDYANKLLSEGIATNGKGWLNVVVNPTMGVVGGNVYGHIWNDIEGTNWESNGARAVVVTKNTRPAIQGRQWVNLDKWIRGDDMADKVDTNLLRIIHSEMEGWDLDRTHRGEYDKQFNDSWGGANLKDVIWEKWNKNGNFRADRERNRKFWEKYNGKIAEFEGQAEKIKTLEARIKELEAAAGSGDAEKKLQAIKDALGVK